MIITLVMCSIKYFSNFLNTIYTMKKKHIKMSQGKISSLTTSLLLEFSEQVKPVKLVGDFFGL